MTECRTASFPALVTLAAVSAAAAQQATYNYDVPSGQSKAVRLRNVPEGAVLAVLVKLEEQIGIAVLYGEEADKSEKGEKTPAHRGQLLRRARQLERPRDPGGGGHDRRAQAGGAEEGSGGAPAAGAAEARRPIDLAPSSRRA